MSALYNEIAPFPAEWLRNLERAGHIAPGVVVERDIRDIAPAELAGFTQAHFFAGIGVWSHALRLAGWPDSTPVWTGSCPCQPFSTAGKGAGFDDERHLWPDWFRLIRECRPGVVFGEQVASPDGIEWLDAVHADLEGAGYTVGAAVLPAAGVGAPHGRHRTFFVAISDLQRRQGLGVRVQPREPRCAGDEAPGCGETRGVADASSDGLGQGGEGSGRRRQRHRDHGEPVGLGDSGGAGLALRLEQLGRFRALRLQGQTVAQTGAFRGATRGFWGGADWLLCRDEEGPRLRPVERGAFPLVDGSPGRVGGVHAYGNAIVAQVAAGFIGVVMDEIGGLS